MTAEAWTQSQELRSRAFGFLSEAGSCTSLEDLHARFVTATVAFGFHKVCFIRLMAPGGPFDPQFVAGEVPEEWLARYMERDYGHVDPTIPMTFQSRQAFTWDQVEDRHPGRDTRTFFGEARELFAKDSFVVPVWGPYGELSVVELMSDRPIVLAAEEAALLQGLGTLYATMALSLSEGAPAAPPTVPAELTRRERQCVYWLANGKFAHEIADLLNLSPHTVRQHIESARAKLQVATGAELVRKALTLGILLPDVPALGRRRETPQI